MAPSRPELPISARRCFATLFSGGRQIPPIRFASKHGLGAKWRCFLATEGKSANPAAVAALAERG